MTVATGWGLLEAEARARAGAFPLRAYSEFMPPPYVGVKPYCPDRARCDCTAGATDDGSLDIDEYEWAHELVPGLARIGEHVIDQLGKLLDGKDHVLSSSLLDGNPAWPDELAARAGSLGHDPRLLILPLALSKSRDDKGNDRWTLFGASHLGAARPFWHGLEADELARVLAWAGAPWPFSVIADPDDVAPSIRPLLHDGGKVRTIVTLRPFAQLPADVRAAYLAGDLVLAPTPASLVFHEHRGYQRLDLPYAQQIALLKLFPRIEESCTLRVPQSGWLDELVEAKVARTHRWQRVQRDDAVKDFTDRVTTALFSCEPDALGLYDKPMARNVQLWTEDYAAVLDGPGADRAALQRAAAAIERGGRFGYRFVFPPMQAGARALYWHVPLIARPGAALLDAAPSGLVTAERTDAAPVILAPRVLDRAPHRAAAAHFPHEPGRRRFTTTHNARKLLDARDHLGAPLSPSFARALLRVGRDTSLDAWIADLPDQAADRAAGARLAATLRGCIGGDDDPGPTRTFAATANRAFEEKIWRTIASLAEGDFRQKVNADAITANRGRTGGPAAEQIGLQVPERNDLEALGDHLRREHDALIAKHGMTGRAEVLDHRFAWETDFEFPWMQGWAANQRGEARERNLVVLIPGRNRGEAIVMGDHYDTAYMEDVYDADRGGDGLRAGAAGADDNHSATTALLAAADVLLPMARDGLLERDVWLVHLTGEEFPADCMGARALCQALVENNLVLTTTDGAPRDVSSTAVVGVYVLDMIGHNHDRDRDVFQIASGEGAGSARLALHAHRATERWNRAVDGWNRERPDLGRADRMPDGSSPPPPFAHLALRGEIRVEWEPKSALYNTDGQIFSDVGIPVVLFMENYDISRTGYHDTHDTMANIDLDYCAALTAIAIEAVAEAACA